MAFASASQSVVVDVTKICTLGQGGVIEKKAGWPFSKGWAETAVCDFSDFGENLGLDSARTVLGYGLLGKDGEYPEKVGVTVKDKLAYDLGAVSRSQDFYTFPPGTPGVIMIDHDPDPAGPPMTPDSLIEEIARIMPTFGQ